MITLKRGWYWILLREHQEYEPAFFTDGKDPVFIHRFGITSPERVIEVRSRIEPPAHRSGAV